MKTHRHLALAAALLLATALPAQQVTPPALDTTGTAAALGAAAPSVNPQSALRTPQSDDDIVQLSPFTVTGETDRGYQALATASGSRIRTDLRDTAASISPFTEEFLNDIGATSIEDMLTYAGNSEPDTTDTANFTDNNSRGAGSQNSRFRIRGLAAGVSVDFVPSDIPLDLYNVGRAEIASGANSILFGVGSPGGIVTLTTKRADAQRNKLTIKNTIGTWTSPAVSGIPYYRATLDYNLVLMPKTLGLRLLALYENGDPRNGWRKYDTGRDKRINPVLYIKPLKDTTIHISYETGATRQPTPFRWNLSDSYSAWTDAGSIKLDGFNNANNNLTGPPGTRQFNGAGNNPYFILVNDANGATPGLYDFRRSYYTINSSNNNGVRSDDPTYKSYYYDPSGPAAFRDIKFNSGFIVIEQRLGNLNLELAYHTNTYNATAHAPAGAGGQMLLFADPNTLVSSYAWNGLANLLPGPNPGAFYTQATWNASTAHSRNDVLRLTADYALNLKTYGRHRIIALLERSWNENQNNTTSEIIADDNQQAVGTNADPNANAAALTRRQYVIYGDYSTYYSGDWRTPLDPNPFTIAPHEYHSTYATTRPIDITGNKYAQNSLMLALQSYWLKDTLVTILGLRLDDIDYGSEGTRQLTDPNDPLIRDKTHVLNEFIVNDQWTHYKYRPWTYSAGAVYHVPLLSNRLSLFANYSSNRAAPDLTGRRVLPDGGPPPPTEGRTLDYGITLDPLGNGKIYLRLTRYDSRQIRNLGITYNSTDPENSAAPGFAALTSIYNALYYLNSAPNLNPALGPITPPDGPMTTDQFKNKPIYNAALIDAYSRGYEAELTASITKNFTLRATFSYSDRDRTNILQEYFDYFNANIGGWFDMAGDKQMTNVNYPGTTTPMTVQDYIRTQLYGADSINPTGGAGGTGGTGGVRNELATVLLNQAGPRGSRPYKASLRADYGFRNGPLKGIKLNAGVRYQSYPFMPDPLRQPHTFVPITDATRDLALNTDEYQNPTTMRGNSLLFYDAMIAYKCKLFSGRATLTLQFNINNIFNTGVVTPARYLRLSPDSDQIALQRVYLSPPRTYRLSAQIDF